MKSLTFFLIFIFISSCSELKLIENENEALNDDTADNTSVIDELENDESEDLDAIEELDADTQEVSDDNCTDSELTGNEKQAVLQIFEEFDKACIKTVSSGSYYEIYHENEIKGFAISSSHSGFDGPVEMMTGIDKDGKILSIAEVNQYESWWGRLGSWFFEQFANIEISKISTDFKYNDNCWPCTEMYDSFNPYEVDAVSGATISSNAVTKDIWDAIYVYDDLK